MYTVFAPLYLKMDGYIQWPNDINSAKNAFFGIGGFPGVVGAIDGTHIRIREPKNNANAIANIICQSMYVLFVTLHKKFTFASIRWPGSCHDSFILRQTDLWDQYEQNRRDGLILGGSGYPCRSWLLTPYIQPGTPAQQAFNRALAKTRTVVECSFGRLKRCFQSLHDELRVSPETATILIGSGMVLHNISVDLGMPDFEITNDEIGNELLNNENVPFVNNQFRDYVAATYFS